MKHALTRRDFCKVSTASLVLSKLPVAHAQAAIPSHLPNSDPEARREWDEATRASHIHIGDLGDQQLASWGLVDVTKAPFNADPTGKSDATSAIQTGITFAREHNMVLWFPAGTYRISDTLRCAHGDYDPVTGGWRGRDYPCVIMGSRAGHDRPKIYLAPNSPGFGHADNRKYVVHFWSWDEAGPPAVEDNINMSQMLIGIDIVIGEGNNGAVGVRCRGAQGMSVQDCAIDATHGYSGLDGGAGSGGGHYNVSITGGKIGVDMREAQPAPTIAGFNLRGQTQHAILYDGRQTLNAVGCYIEFKGTGAAVVVGVRERAMLNGQVSMVDSRIDCTGSSSNVVFSGCSSLYLNNVYVRGSKHLANWGNSDIVDLGQERWTCIKNYAHGRSALPVTSQGLGPFIYTSPIYVNGRRQVGDFVETIYLAPPSDLVSRHIWNEEFPSWEDKSAVNVRSAPYHAAGNGKDDDFNAIQRAIDEHEVVYLPKGVYPVSRTLRLKSNTRLIGLHNCFTTIAATSGGDFNDHDKPQPVIATADSKSARNLIAFLGIATGLKGSPVAGVYALDWRCGQDSMYRSARILSEPSGRHGLELNGPLVLVTGNGGGRWYNFYQESWHFQGSAYRHLSVLGTTEPLRLYQCNPEHARGDVNMEIREAANIFIYGLKSEGNLPVIRVSNSQNVLISGYGGNAATPCGKTLFEFINCRDFLVGNIIDSARFAGGSPNYYAGIGISPENRSMLSSIRPDGTKIETAPLERPVLFLKGETHA